MFGPRSHQECLHITVPSLSITENPPPVRTSAPSYAAILMDRVHELRLPFRNHSVFDRNQQRSPLNIGAKLFDEDGHTPVVPGTQIRGGIGKSCKERKHHTSNCSNPGRHKSDLES